MFTKSLGLLREYSSTIRGVLLFAVAASFILYHLTGWPIDDVVLVITLAAYLVCLPGMSLLPKVMSILSLVFGHVLLFVYQGGFIQWQAAMINNLGMVALFVTAPLLAYPLRHGGYIEYMYHFINTHFKKSLPQIAFVTSLTCILSSFLNLGAARVVYELFAERIKQMEQIFATAITQGFSLAAFWSPYFAGVAITLSLTGVSFVEFLPYGLGILGLGLVLSVILTFKEIYVLKANEDEGDANRKSSDTYAVKRSEGNLFTVNAKGFELIFVFVGLFLTLFMLEKWLDLSLIIIISVIAFFYSIVWSIAIRKSREYVGSLKNDYIRHVLPSVHNESIMFISGVFFAQMIQLTAFPGWLSSQLMNISQVSVIFTILAIILLIVGLAFFIHQVLPITVLATNISPEMIGLSPELFAMTLIISWGICPLVSPLNAMNIITTNVLHLKTFQLGRWNLKYASVVICCATLFITLLNTMIK